jgi:hypothetical protein
MTETTPERATMGHELVHPRICDSAWCLVEPDIREGGRIAHWNGYHRGNVDVINAEYGHVVEVTLARNEEGFRGVFGEPCIHIYTRAVEGCDGRFEHVLTPTEARELAKHLVDTANWIEQHPENVYEEGEIAALAAE